MTSVTLQNVTVSALGGESGGSSIEVEVMREFMKKIISIKTSLTITETSMGFNRLDIAPTYGKWNRPITDVPRMAIQMSLAAEANLGFVTNMYRLEISIPEPELPEQKDPAFREKMERWKKYKLGAAKQQPHFTPVATIVDPDVLQLLKTIVHYVN